MDGLFHICYWWTACILLSWAFWTCSNYNTPPLQSDSSSEMQLRFVRFALLTCCYEFLFLLTSENVSGNSCSCCSQAMKKASQMRYEFINGEGQYVSLALWCGHLALLAPGRCEAALRGLSWRNGKDPQSLSHLPLTEVMSLDMSLRNFDSTVSFLAVCSLAR